MTQVAESTVALSVYNAIVALDHPVTAPELTKFLSISWMPIRHEEVCVAIGQLLDRGRLELHAGLFDVTGRGIDGKRMPVRKRNRNSDGWF